MRAVSVPVLVGLILLLGITSVCHADPLDPEQIKAILRTNTEQEDGFIERAVAMVNNGTLPAELFQSTFLWARKKQKHKFQYFQQALTLRAADIGIVVK
jgi:hypothetical protein